MVTGISSPAMIIAAESPPAAAGQQGQGTPTQRLPTISVTEQELDTYVAPSSSTALGLDLSARETPQAVTVITRARMDDQATNDISSVLDQAVGVTVNATSPLGSDGVYFYSRGFEIRNFQIDGTPRPPAIYGFSETTTDMASYERVEIVRGATGLMSGAGSPSASVNLVRKRPTGQGSVSFNGQIGSFDHNRVEADLNGALSSSGALRGRAIVVYEDSDAYVDRTNTKKKIFYGIAEFDLTDSTLLSAGIEYQDFGSTGASRGGVPVFFTDGSDADLPRSTNTGAEGNNLSRETTRLFASLEHSFANGWSVRLEGEESQPDYDEAFSYMYGPFDAATGAGSSVGTARWAGDLTQRIVSLTASGSFAWLGHQHQVMLGASHNIAKDDNDEYSGWWNGGPDYWASLSDAWRFLGTGTYATPDLSANGYHSGGRIEQNGVYAALRLRPAESVSVIGGARISSWKETEWDDYSGTRSSKTLTDESGVFTPYAGIVFDLSRSLSAYASYTDIFEPQGAEDVQGNRLDPLLGNNYEIGLKGEFQEGRVNATLALFRVDQDNLAVEIPNAPPNPNGNTPFTAESGTSSRGFELEVVGEVLSGLQVGGGYAYFKVEDADDNPLITEVPNRTFKFFGTYRLPAALQAFTVGGNLRWQGNSYLNESGPNGEDFEQDAQVAVDAVAKYRFSDKVSLSLNVNNIFDSEYYSGVTWGHGIYETPREVLLGFKWTL